MDVLKVSSKSNPVSVAGAIAGIIREKQIVEVQGIGAGAVSSGDRLCPAFRSGGTHDSGPGGRSGGLPQHPGHA